MDKMSFPQIPLQNHAVKLTANGEKSIRAKHPWIFSNSIVKLDNKANPGDRAIIFGKKKNQLMGIALVDPHSPIRLKMLSFGKKAVINQDWFDQKLSQAYSLRTPLFDTNTDSYRLCYGENDGLPGLIIDVYHHVAVIKSYSLIWIPYLEWIINSVISTNDINPETINISTIVLRLSRNVSKNKRLLYDFYDGQILHGSLEHEVIHFVEHDVKFSANVIKGHKTGYFLDHRDNRRKVGAFAQNKKVLDVFSYAGGFSVHALVGGAKQVTSIDISKQALELAKYNAKLNASFNNHRCIAGDAFAEMKNLIQANEEFDLVIVDPPSFAKRASEVDLALNSYKRLAKLAIQLCSKRAILVMASCSSRVTKDDFFKLIEQVLVSSKRKFTLLETTTHDIDHPITFPEGAYLKTMYFQLD